MERKIEEMINRKIAEGREYRNTRVLETRAEITEEQNDEKVVQGYATTFNDQYLLWAEDGIRVFEQVDPHAFDDCDMSDVIMQYDHAGRVFARISNDTLKLDVDDRGLRIEADLGGTELGRQLYEEISGGYTNKMSFGFIVAEDSREIVEDYENDTVTVNRTITKISKLYDVSAVSIPANGATDISARNYGNGVIAEVKAERQRAEDVKTERMRLATRARALRGAN